MTRPAARGGRDERRGRWNEKKRDGQTTGEVEKIVQAVAHGELTRRQFIERGVALGLSLTAHRRRCSPPAASEADQPARAPAPMDTTLPEKISIFNWSDYMSPQCLKDFEDAYGVKVKETLLRRQRGAARQAEAPAPPATTSSSRPTCGCTVLSQDRPHPAARHVATSPTSSTSRTPSSRSRRSTTRTSRTARSTRCRTCSGRPATRRRSPRSRRRMDSWDQLWDAALQGPDLDARTRRARRSASGSSSWATRPTRRARRSSTPRSRSLIEQKPLVLKYDRTNTRRSIVQGIAAHALLGRRRRPRDQGHPAGERRSTCCPARATSCGPTASPSRRRPRTSTRRTSSSTTCSTPSRPGRRPTTSATSASSPEGVQYITEPDPGGDAARPTEQIDQRPARRGPGRVPAQYDEAWRAVGVDGAVDRAD